MKKKILPFVFICLTSMAFSQNRSLEKLLSMKPASIVYKKEVQIYDVALKWQNLDAVNGNKFNCNGIKAQFTIGLPGDSVRWDNVELANINDLTQKEFTGELLPSFSNFTYKGINMDFLKVDFYKKIAPEHIDFARWLVSDAIQVQGLAWYVFDSMQYAKEFIPKALVNNNIKFENWVAFSNRYQKLVWTGIGEYNGEMCAIVQFESLYNPLEINNTTIKIKGRSLYWGEMWISLQDKQVEKAKMFEDVVFKLKSDNFPQEQLLDLQREVSFEKVRNHEKEK